VVLLAKPSRFVIPPKKLDPIFAIQIASKLLLLLHSRLSGSIFWIAALLMTCSITSMTASMAAKPTTYSHVRPLSKWGMGSATDKGTSSTCNIGT